MLGTRTVARPRRWDQPFSADSSCPSDMTDADVAAILTRPPFCELDESGYRATLSLRDILKNDSRIVSYDTGDIVVRRGDWGQSAFFIMSGSARVEIERGDGGFPDEMLGRSPAKTKTLVQSIAQLWQNRAAPECRDRDLSLDRRVGLRQTAGASRIYLQDVSAVLDEYRTAELTEGQWFGELSALRRTARSATVFASEPMRLLEIRWQGLRDLMRHDSRRALSNFVESVFRERALDEFLRNDPAFSGLSQAQIETLANGAEFQTYGDYDSPKPFRDLAEQGLGSAAVEESLIFAQGDYPNAMIVVRSGIARLTVEHHAGHRTVGYLTAGQSYGLTEILGGLGREDIEPYACSVRAMSYLNAVLIPSAVIEDVVGNGEVPPSLLRSLPATPPTSGEPNDLLEFLVGKQFVQGSAAMVIDLNRCVRCDDCVHACSTAHDGNPRFVRQGPQHGHHMLANACLHCADPLCLVECPTGAIHRHPASGNVIINEETCIGCSQCANNCQYDAIRMVPIRDSKGQRLVDQATELPVLQATKCDLCLDQIGGPACQNACSHDALARVDLRDRTSAEKVFGREGDRP